MRSVALGLFTMFAVSGCATVSMVSGQAVVETKVTPEQTALRDASEAYVAKAEAEQWVTKSTGLFDLAKVLVDGRSDDDDKPKSYTDLIKAETADVAVLEERLIADINAASEGLQQVNAESDVVMMTPHTSKASLRKDVVSFESALVAAQKSRRNFAKAVSIVAARDNVSVASIDTVLASFDKVIDSTRDRVEALADKQVELPQNTAAS